MRPLGQPCLVPPSPLKTGAGPESKNEAFCAGEDQRRTSGLSDRLLSRGTKRSSNSGVISRRHGPYRWGLKKILDAQSDVWSFDEELADARERHILEAGAADKCLGHLGHLRMIVDLDPEKGGPLCIGRLIDTQVWHQFSSYCRIGQGVVGGRRSRGGNLPVSHLEVRCQRARSWQG